MLLKWLRGSLLLVKWLSDPQRVCLLLLLKWLSGPERSCLLLLQRKKSCLLSPDRFESGNLNILQQWLLLLEGVCLLLDRSIQPRRLGQPRLLQPSLLNPVRLLVDRVEEVVKIGGQLLGRSGQLSLTAIYLGQRTAGQVTACSGRETRERLRRR